MKKTLLLILCLPLLQACTKKINREDGVDKISAAPNPFPPPCLYNIWQNRGQVPIYFDEQRDKAFAIGNKGYVLKLEATVPNYRVWEYNISDGSWTPKGLFPASARLEGTIVVVGAKAYFGLGIDFDNGANQTNFHDWWEYDPSTDQWTQKADFPAAARTAATAFAASSKAYVVGGYDREVTDTYLKQTWQYDPSTNTWEQKANFPGAARDHAAGFGIGNKGYVGTGKGKIILFNNPVTIYFNDFYEYNSQTNSWAQKASYPGPTRFRAFSFVIGGAGFIGGGYNASEGYRDMHIYGVQLNQWTKKADYPGYGFSPAHFGGLFHFSTGNHGYVIEKDHLSGSGSVQTMWRYIKEEFCLN